MEKYLIFAHLDDANAVEKIAFDKYKELQQNIDVKMVEDNKVYGKQNGAVNKSNPTEHWYTVQESKNIYYIKANGMLEPDISNKNWAEKHKIIHIYNYNDMVDKGYIAKDLDYE